MPTLRRSGLLACLSLLAILPVRDHPVDALEPLPPLSQEIPSRLSDGEFWRMINEFSEPGGFFRSDNLVSNETAFQHVLPELSNAPYQGGVYMGVGPDQNFTYVVALKPRIAFIVDIRRQNMLQHLFYKALIEMSPTRADFLSRLFSRPRPAGLDSSATPQVLFTAYDSMPSDSLLLSATLAAVKDRLVRQHKFTLTEDDLRSIGFIQTAFYAAGPELTYSFPNVGRGGAWGRRMPTYAELMREADAQGVQRSYLATEENYRALKAIQEKNLLVPLVGDFGGPKAITMVGQYLQRRGARVTAFYTSNVEQYLFQGGTWSKFCSNVGTLPVDSSATFIRAVFNFVQYRDTVPFSANGPRSATMLASIPETVRACNENRIQTYYDVIGMSR